MLPGVRRPQAAGSTKNDRPELGAQVAKQRIAGGVGKLAKRAFRCFFKRLIAVPP